MAKLHRIFIAVNLNENIKKNLAVYEDKYLDLPGRWTRQENLHITLVFLGNASDEEIVEICKSIDKVVLRHQPFDITLNKICYDKLPPRMVWAVGKNSAELGALQKDLESALYNFGGGVYDKRHEYKFTPHITLARINQSKLRQIEEDELPIINDTINQSFNAASIELMESELKRGGPQYTILESFNLGKQGI